MGQLSLRNTNAGRRISCNNMDLDVSSTTGQDLSACSDTIVVVHDSAELAPQQQGAGSSFGKPFVCDVCKSSYARVDHLARHFRCRMEVPCFAFLPFASYWRRLSNECLKIIRRDLLLALIARNNFRDR